MPADRTPGDITRQKQAEECRDETDLENVNGRQGYPLMMRNDVHAVRG